MAWIRTLSEGEASGPLKEQYQADLDELGVVMNATKAFSVRPDLAFAYKALQAAIWGTGGLTPRERQLVQFVISDRIGSTYCVLVYAAALERQLNGPAGLHAVLEDHHNAGLTEREVAILDYALAVTVGHPREADLARLREVGLDDPAILDVAFTAAFRLFGSRLYDGLGVETDPFFLEQKDLMEALGSHAEHR